MVKKFIKCDLHIHSQFSDGQMSIREIVDHFGERDFGAIAITDHICEKNSLAGKVSHGLNLSLSIETFDDYLATINYEGERAQRLYNMLVIPGYEITKNSFANHRSAHILVLGIERFIQPELSVREILTLARSYGALTVAAHPFHTGEFEFQTFHLWSKRDELRDLIDAWEVNHRRKISTEVLNSGLPLLANSDFHHSRHQSSWKSKIFSKQNQDDIFRAIRHQELDFFLDS